MSEELIETLLDFDGVTEIRVEKTMTVTHRKEPTGEIDKLFQEVREPVISEEDFEEIADMNDINYLGTVDVVGDYYLKDRFTSIKTFEDDDE